MDLFELRFRLGWTVDREESLRALGAPTLVPARVGVEHRGAYGLLAAEVTTGQLAGRLRTGPGPWPAVGDWVAVAPGEGGLGIIHQVLPRLSALERRRPGLQEPQVVAANVDVVLVLTAPGRGVNPRRVERYLAAVWASGARPVVVLSKSDLDDDPGRDLRALEGLARGVICLGTSAATGDGLARLRQELPPGCTGALVGPSGVGKSSLLNALLAEDRQATAAVRLTDDKGRHTTTRRELVELPGGGCLIDTPGMREFGLWDADQGVAQAFTDIDGLAAQCRFRDCRHQGEPGCAVVEAVAEGSLGGDRLASFEKLRREQAHQERQSDWRLQARNKERWKIINKDQRARRRVDPKLRDD